MILSYCFLSNKLHLELKVAKDVTLVLSNICMTLAVFVEKMLQHIYSYIKDITGD